MRVKSSRGGSNRCNSPTSSYRRSGAIARRSAILLSGTAALALSIAQPASAITINDGEFPNPEYVNGTNQFPSVVATFRGSQYWCTGALIDSRTVLTAAHCYQPDLNKVSFQTNASTDLNPIAISSYFTHRSYNGGLDNDIAVISLSRPVTNIRPLPLVPSIPDRGQRLFLVGYSNGGSGTNCCDLPNGIRRMATTEFGSQRMLQASFRDPDNPGKFDSFGLTGTPGLPDIPTSQFEGSTVGGDSGSPVFIRTPDGLLVQIGVLRGGVNPFGEPGEYGDISQWTPLALFLTWVMENNPLRQVTAAAGDFKWSNPAAWTDPFFDAAYPNGAAPNNTVGDVGNNPARYYDVTLSNPGTITLDMNAQIDNLSIMGPQSQLVIGGPYTLQVLLDTRLSAGALTMLPGGILATGTYTQTGGLLQFQLAPSGSGRIEIANTATLGGTLGVTVMPGLYGLSTLTHL
jgi:subtilase-type serine protease